MTCGHAAVFIGTSGSARMFHESFATTLDMAVLPGVLGCWLLRRTIQVRLGTNTLRLPGGTPIFTVSRHQFMKHPGSGMSLAHWSRRVEWLRSLVIKIFREHYGPLKQQIPYRY